jgi:hypothetical protein
MGSSKSSMKKDLKKALHLTLSQLHGGLLKVIGPLLSATVFFIFLLFMFSPILISERLGWLAASSLLIVTVNALWVAFWGLFINAFVSIRVRGSKRPVG